MPSREHAISFSLIVHANCFNCCIGEKTTDRQPASQSNCSFNIYLHQMWLPYRLSIYKLGVLSACARAHMHLISIQINVRPWWRGKEDIFIWYIGMDTFSDWFWSWIFFWRSKECLRRQNFQPPIHLMQMMVSSKMVEFLELSLHSIFVEYFIKINKNIDIATVAAADFVSLLLILLFYAINFYFI